MPVLESAGLEEANTRVTTICTWDTGVEQVHTCDDALSWQTYVSPFDHLPSLRRQQCIQKQILSTSYSLNPNVWKDS